MNNKIYVRQYYMDKIEGFIDSDLIKVITGIRRCGKSCFLLSIIDRLIMQGVNDKDIIQINLDKKGFKSIKTPPASVLPPAIPAEIGMFFSMKMSILEFVETDLC